MPSVTTGDNAVHSSSPDLGSAPSDGLKQVLGVIDKKVRNMEKKKSKLDDYQTRKNKGERLNQDQLEALSKAPEVAHNLDFARELQKNFLALNVEMQKTVKKATRREQLKREEAERKRLKAVLEVQYLLEQLGEESVRQDLTQSSGEAPLLTESELTGLDEFYKLIGPERDSSVRLAEQFEEASVHLWEVMEGRDKAVAGTTYKALKETLDKMLLSGYFDRTQTHQNGVCEEETGAAAAAAESSESEDRPAEPEGSAQEYTETIEVESTEFVNRQFVPETTYSSSDKEQGAEWNTSSQAVSALQQPQQPPAAMSPALVSSEPHTLNAVLPTPATDPVVRKQVVQDLMAQMQGTFNFMQDSMLEFEGPPLDPAIVSAQPMKPAQMVCPPESRLPQHNALSVQPEHTQVPMVSAPKEAYSSTPPLYQPPHNSEPRPQTDSIDPQQPQVFQPVSKPLHSGINVNAAPFQSMQAVFNLNAPVPPTSEIDSQKISSQYQSGYGQGYSTQANLPAEQQEIPQEALQSVGPFHSQDQGIPSAGGHQSAPQQPSGQGTGFGRPGQSFYSNRAMPRAGPRNPRGALNGYRGPSNGFRGGYDGYRAPFPNTPNTGYGQTQFSTPRDYSNNTYQRDGYQQSFKRGATQGPRGCSRGRGGSYRSSRGMGPMAAQQTS
ncbi:caprin-1a isoform X3 [Rhinichthys klamathensis goyatoka]|uniref:caprin-1a isoform X3 n=1 Tax=Rhinichthys klamathensis goyatoka TaxID=3034132 RepID=UPI0024B4A6C4|nr:caprin-1a isoform X3 [Rhinichthys klamathensis goyatoka]